MEEHNTSEGQRQATNSQEGHLTLEIEEHHRAHEDECPARREGDEEDAEECPSLNGLSPYETLALGSKSCRIGQLPRLLYFFQVDFSRMMQLVFPSLRSFERAGLGIV